MKPFLLLLPAILLVTGCKPESDSQTSESSSDLSGQLELFDGHARPAPNGANSAAYLTVYNGTEQDDTLLSVQTDAAQISSMHESYLTEEGLSGMRPVEKVSVPSGDTLSLKPGGLHIMLMEIAGNFAEKDSLKLHLKFSRSGKKTIFIPVRN